MADRTTTVRVAVNATATGLSTFSRFSRLAGVAALGVAGLTIAAGAGALKLYDYADAAGDANDRIANINKQMGLFGPRTAEVTKRIEDYALATSKSTAVDLTSIKSTQAKLLTFKELAKTADETGGNFDRATKAAIDLAAAGFGTAEANAVQLGKALQDPVKGLTALTRSGVTFTDQQKKVIQTLVDTGKVGQAQDLVLKAIETQVGGTAKATAGGFELMKNRVSIFAQELALKAQPYMDRFGNFMIKKGGPAMLQFGQVLAREVVPKVKAFANFVGNDVVPAVIRLAHSFQKNVLPQLKAFGTFISRDVVPVAKEFMNFIVQKLAPALGKTLSGALDGARGLFHQVANSVKDNRPQLEDMWAKLKKVANFLTKYVFPALGQMYRTELPALGFAIGIAIGTIASIWQKFTDVYNVIRRVIGAISDMKNALSNLPGSGLAGKILGAAVPGRTSSFGTDGRTASVTVNFNGLVTDPQAAAREVSKVLQRHTVYLGSAA